MADLSALAGSSAIRIILLKLIRGLRTGAPWTSHYRSNSPCSWRSTLNDEMDGAIPGEYVPMAEKRSLCCLARLALARHISSRHPGSRHNHPGDANDHQNNTYSNTAVPKFDVIAKNKVVQHHHSGDYG